MLSKQGVHCQRTLCLCLVLWQMPVTQPFSFTKGGYNTETVLFLLSLPSNAFSEAGRWKGCIFWQWQRPNWFWCLSPSFPCDILKKKPCSYCPCAGLLQTDRLRQHCWLWCGLPLKAFFWEGERGSEGEDWGFQVGQGMPRPVFLRALGPKSEAENNIANKNLF